MKGIAAFGFIALLSSVSSQLDLYPDVQTWSPIPVEPDPEQTKSVPIEGPVEIPDEYLPVFDNEDSYQPAISSDGQIRVIIQKSNQAEQLRTAGYQPYPVPGGIFYINPNPDVVIQPPPIILRPPQSKPIRPPPFEVEPPQLPPVTPPSICIKPDPLPPVNVPPILVRPKPLPSITPPAIFVRPPKPLPIQQQPIIIRQPDLPLINPPPIVVRPHSHGQVCPQTIYFRTSALDRQDNSDSPYSIYSQ